MIAPAEILRQVKDPDPAVRERAVRAGARLLPADTLVEQLRNGSDHVLRNAALEMLKERGPEAGPLALALLGDADNDVVLQAVLLLDHLKDPRAVEPLRRVLKHPGANVVQAAIVALGHIGNAAIISDLAAFLGADLWLRVAAVEALGDLRTTAAVGPLATMLDDELLSTPAAESIARIGGEEAFTRLATRWVQHQGDSKLLELVAHVLEGLCGDVPEVASFALALEIALDASPVSARLSAARCLLVTGVSAQDGRALDLLTGACNSMDLPACLQRRSDLVETLVNGDGVRFAWGLRLAAMRPREVKRETLLAAMDKLRGHSHTDALAEALLAADPLDERGGAALVSLYARLPRDVRMAFGPVLRRHDAALRGALLDASLADAATRVVLATVVEPNVFSAAAAIAALPAVMRPEALSHATANEALLRALPWPRLLNEDPDECGRIAVEVCDQAGLSLHLFAIRELAAVRVHREYIRLLGRLRDLESVPLLAKLAEGGPDTVRPFALAALGVIGGNEAREALRNRAADDTTWARFAFRALADCRTPAELPVFRLAAAHGDWHVRMIAAEVLAGSGCAEDRALLAGLETDPSQAVADRARAIRIS